MRASQVLLSLSFSAGLLASTSHAQFVNDDSNIPNEGSSTENVDFADVDQDGDWDIVVADGGDGGDDQNRLWINMGGTQGGTTGVYSDQTGTQMPSIQDDSRDAEFGDFDSDGDLDIYISNTAQISNQGNRWLINGGSGSYTEETGLRWLNLGTAGSSIPSSLVIAAGNPGGGDTFIDWSCDCDFADLDNDGDLDLFHSTYGGAFGGDVPSRIFLNDGGGIFEEFNPTGFQLFTAQIADGQPGLWCEGVQDSNTFDTTGAECDIAMTALDIDLGDFDGDFDIDVLHGSRSEAPRVFVNRLDGSSLAPDNGGTMLFRDVTNAVLPAGYVSGGGNYEQEIGDMDGDGDLDIYGLNWGGGGGGGFADVTIRNDGAGVFTNTVALGGSSADDNEGDFIDYDNDGDLDLFVANFSGSDKLYRNDNNGGSTFAYTQITAFNSVSVTSLDADCCDTDGDGDYDILVAADNNQPNRFYRNTTQTPDTHAPYIPNVEALGSVAVDGSPVPVRAHVYDNAPYYITWYNETEVDVFVEGIPMGTIPAVSSAGQIFRAELPGNLHGDVSYQFRSQDEYGNTGVSAVQTGTTFTSPGLVTYGVGTNGTSGEPEIKALTVPTAGETLFLLGDNAPALTPCILGIGANQIPPTAVGTLVTLNIFSPVTFLVLEFASTDANGQLLRTYPIDVSTPTGFTAYAQFFVLGGTTQAYASSKGLAMTVQ